jgi:hypothetical protein
MHLRICRKRLPVKPSSPNAPALATLLGELARDPADRVLHRTLQYGIMEVMAEALAVQAVAEEIPVIPLGRCLDTCA